MGILADWQIERDIKITPFEKYDREAQKGRISHGLGAYGYDARIGYKFRVFKPFVPGAVNPVVDPLNFNPGMLEEVDYTPKYNHNWMRHPLSDRDDRIPSEPEYCNTCGAWKGTPSEHKNQCPTTAPDHILIPPNSFALGETVEWFDIPRDVLCVVVGKSTYARCGIIVNVTPGEPEWSGRWTIEISNTTPLPAKIYCGQGIAQCMFFRTDGLRELNTRVICQSFNVLVKDEEFEKASCRVSYKDKKGRYDGQTGITNPSGVS